MSFMFCRSHLFSALFTECILYIFYTNRHEIRSTCNYPIRQQRILQENAIPTDNLPVTLENSIQLPFSISTNVSTESETKEPVIKTVSLERSSPLSSCPPIPNSEAPTSDELELDVPTQEPTTSYTLSKPTAVVWEEKYAAAQNEIQILKETVLKLEEVVKEYEDILARYFTPGQIRLLRSKEKKKIK